MATKRKRNESVDMTYSEEAPQPTKKTLAFRSSPQFKPPPIITHQKFSRPFTPSFLTPVDSDDDLPFNTIEGIESDSRHRSGSNHSSHSSSSTSLLAVDGQHDIHQKMDLFLSPPREVASSPARPLGRPRSNGMLQPIQSLHASMGQRSTQAASLSDRAPTPIHQRFPDCDMEMSDSTSSAFPIRTILSPMLNGDLPSPGEEDPDHAMGGLGILDEPAFPFPASLSSTRELSSSAPTVSSSSRTTDHHAAAAAAAAAGRQGRLHMGYRADCEKCRLRVPGHYTHILWS